MLALRLQNRRLNKKLGVLNEDGVIRIRDRNTCNKQNIPIRNTTKRILVIIINLISIPYHVPRGGGGGCQRRRGGFSGLNTNPDTDGEAYLTISYTCQGLQNNYF
jgi:hypothetical protein